MKKRKVEYFLGLLVFVAFLAGLATAFSSPRQSLYSTSAIKSKVDNVILKESYEKDVVALLQAFSADYAIADEQAKKTLISATKDKLLTLRVPTTDKDVHLAIVIALTRLEEGSASTIKEEVNSGIVLFNGTIQSVLWLSGISALK